MNNLGLHRMSITKFYGSEYQWFCW